MAHLIYNSPIGPIVVSGNKDYIEEVRFLEPHHIRPTVAENPAKPLQKAAEQLTEYFCGLRQEFDLPLVPTGTPFQQLVWETINQIPYGETRSYKEVANMLNLSGGARAVGMAAANNPFLLLVACHRVIGSSGVLTGYAGGVLRKRWLLQHEGQSVQLPLFA